ncbi:MAG: GAF domain-containing protein [Deltaproteobacteria bacterium]|nr:GAF domain-containing protein [Deltaproteobacteria bacterium]
MTDGLHMQLGDELVKEQLFFRKELRERIRWLIRLRWIAAGSSLVASWLVYYQWRTLPVVTVDLILLFVLLYNLGFHFIWRRLQTGNPREVKPLTIFTHAQIICDFSALYPLIYFTGNLHSPLLIFLIFHVILSGMLLSPLSCFLYCFSVPAVLGGLVTLQALEILPIQPAMFHGPSWVYRLYVPVDAPDMVPFFLLFVAALFITAFLVTSLKLSLRVKGRALLQVSKALDAGNVKLRALYKMVTEMGGCVSLQPLMDVATRNAARIMGVDTCSIKLLDDQRENLIFASTFGLGEEYKKNSRGVKVAGNPIAQKIMDGTLSVIGKIGEKDYSQYPEDIRKEGIASMICLPLSVGKTVSGIFCVYSAEPGTFSEDDVKFFSLMTDLTALSMENLKRDLDKSWFLQKAAHQLRSPLNTVLSMLNLIKNRYLGPVTPKQATTLDRSVKRLQILGDVVADLLNLEIKRMDLQKVVLHPVTAASVLNPLREPYQVLAAEKHVDVAFDIDKSLPPVLADEKLVDDLFTNLIANAVKYTPVGGAVRVTLSRENSKHVRFQVRDTGIGITPDDLPCIFTEFFRSANARQFEEEGTGLGLVVVKEIMDRLKGTISVKSTLGEGTCFTCRLPIADRPSANEDN